MRHGRPIPKTILVMRAHRICHAIAYNVDDFGELVANPRVRPNTVKIGEGLQEARMNADILASYRSVDGTSPRHPAIEIVIADDGPVAAEGGEITSVLTIVCVAIDPIETIASKM